MAYFDGIKVGDKVYSIGRGIGHVIDSTIKVNDSDFVVEFDVSVYGLFSSDGISNGEVSQTLFWQKPEIIDKGKPLPDLKVDAKVIVWNNPESKDYAFVKYKRHFCDFRDNGRICVFSEGKTSHTHHGSYCFFDNYEIVEE